MRPRRTTIGAASTASRADLRRYYRVRQAPKHRVERRRYRAPAFWALSWRRDSGQRRDDALRQANKRTLITTFRNRRPSIRAAGKQHTDAPAFVKALGDDLVRQANQHRIQRRCDRSPSLRTHTLRNIKRSITASRQIKAIRYTAKRGIQGRRRWPKSRRTSSRWQAGVDPMKFYSVYEAFCADGLR